MSRKQGEPAFDDENPEWTEEDFRRTRPAHQMLPPEAVSTFRKTRGQQKKPKKVAVSIRLSREVVEHFKAGGPGWQGRVDEALKKLVKR